MCVYVCVCVCVKDRARKRVASSLSQPMLTSDHSPSPNGLAPPPSPLPSFPPSHCATLPFICPQNKNATATTANSRVAPGPPECRADAGAPRHHHCIRQQWAEQRANAVCAVGPRAHPCCVGDLAKGLQPGLARLAAACDAGADQERPLNRDPCVQQSL